MQRKGQGQSCRADGPDKCCSRWVAVSVHCALFFVRCALSSVHCPLPYVPCALPAPLSALRGRLWVRRLSAIGRFASFGPSCSPLTD